MNETILEITNLNSYDRNWTIVKDINFKLTKGEVFALVGESGSGKTTLVNILGGLIKNFTGSIKFLGKPVTESLRNEKFGILYSVSALIPNLSIAENFSFVIYPKIKMLPIISWAKVNRKAQDILDQYNVKADLKDVVNSLPSEN
jgi:ABC-type sugar transport system ATPase subunit